MKFFAVFCAIAIALALTGCNQMPDTHDADVKALKDNETQWNQDFAAKDVEKLVAHYADNASLLPPGMPPAKGKDAIRKAVKEIVADPGFSLKFQSSRVEVAKSGDLAFTEGSYNMSGTDPATKKVMLDHGSYVTVYAKQADGTWKATSDIVTSEVPPPPPPPSK